MSESARYLTTAYAAIERLRMSCPGFQLTGEPLVLASRSIRTALVAVDERGIAVLRGAGLGRPPLETGRRGCLLTLYSELGLMA
jgi:hypothetical protein